ncbi:hypothetical protein THAOC_23374 [Thalassiosira oceanica]|uniref:Uncharacterized protein n=1 Tax=Thalassiosira oceanica TaxID=159749 RepID=K0RUS7_THAOC|nr:hypothetical protein THAOC_23374 [Thalassiosira oceanica]|eukprot:EJK56690.1 hypothetical protein THAOC_23374 [Thalassiosira oceanica]
MKSAQKRPQHISSEHETCSPILHGEPMLCPFPVDYDVISRSTTFIVGMAGYGHVSTDSSPVAPPHRQIPVCERRRTASVAFWSTANGIGAADGQRSRPGGRNCKGSPNDIAEVSAQAMRRDAAPSGPGFWSASLMRPLIVSFEAPPDRRA